MALEIIYGEGQTPISEEERTGLKVKSLSLQQELDEYEQLNIEKAIKWLIGRKFTAKEALSEPFLRKLHKKSPTFGSGPESFADLRRTSG